MPRTSFFTSTHCTLYNYNCFFIPDDNPMLTKRFLAHPSIDFLFLFLGSRNKNPPLEMCRMNAGFRFQTAVRATILQPLVLFAKLSNVNQPLFRLHWQAEAITSKMCKVFPGS